MMYSVIFVANSWRKGKYDRSIDFGVQIRVCLYPKESRTSLPENGHILYSETLITCVFILSDLSIPSIPLRISLAALLGSSLPDT